MKIKKEASTSSIFLDLKDYIIESKFILVTYIPNNFDTYFDTSDIFLYQLYKIDKTSKVGLAKKYSDEVKEVSTLILEKRSKDDKEFNEELHNIAKYFNAEIISTY